MCHHFPLYFNGTGTIYLAYNGNVVVVPWQRFELVSPEEKETCWPTIL
jgi:hypothetical protein